jgi:glycosyltransferase involved in cell wall biosynthesis
MKILHVAYPFAPVRDDVAGGAEHVLATLDRALCGQGHRSYVVACAGSEVCGELLEISCPEGDIDGSTRESTWSSCRKIIAHAGETLRPDLIHLHGLDFAHYLPAPGIPLIVTLHLPVAWYEGAVQALNRPQSWLHCVSRSQQDTCPGVPNLLPFIPNGVPDLLEGLSPAPMSKRKFALALGRVCPQKGYHLAFAAARLAGVPFLLAGQVHNYEEHRRYFKDEILPACGETARFLGPVRPLRKQQLLSAARCLLVPSLVPETSSLVAMEAGMCGTPVVAYRAGALPEIVRDGETGFLVEDVAEMAYAIHRCVQLDPNVCRASALSRFSAQEMFGRYLQMYESVTRLCASTST